MFDQLAGLTPEAVLCENRQVFAYTFRATDRRVVALFAPDESRRTVTVVSDAALAEVMDVMGNVVPMKPADRFAVQVRLYPSYAVLHGATRVNLENLP